MRVWAEEVTDTAARFSEVCGRSKITTEDVRLAAKHSAVAFLRDEAAMARVQQRVLDLNAEGQALNEDEDEDDEGEEGETDSEDDGIEQESEGSLRFLAGGAEAQAFHAEVLAASAGWSTFQPDDPLRQLIKAAVDSAEVP